MEGAMRAVSLTILAAVSLVGSSLAASSADLVRPVVAYPPAIPIYNWTGFYLGGNLGDAWTTGTLTDSFTGASVSHSNNGAVGGLQFGYNLQTSNNFVFGVEASFDWTSLAASRTTALVVATADTHSMSTLAARFGVAFNNWLLYGKAGGGWVRNEATITSAATGATLSASNTNSGWLLGFGIEYGFMPNWSIRLEYDYLALNTWNFNSTVFAPNADQLSFSRQIETLTVGLNYRF
jgi:outer membrane autotransporter protein